MNGWEWRIGLEGMIGAFCKVELLDGIVREGRISGVQLIPIAINKVVYKLPRAVELNGDSEDAIDFDRMKELTLK